MLQQKFANMSLSLINEESKENIENTSSLNVDARQVKDASAVAQIDTKDKQVTEEPILKSPSPEKRHSWDIAPHLEFTAVPGFKMVTKEEYERLMAQKSAYRQSELMPKLDS